MALPKIWLFLNLVFFVSSKQIPVVDGVIGGVPTSTKSREVSEIPVPQVSGTPVAGKLRYIENSGVCGEYI